MDSLRLPTPCTPSAVLRLPTPAPAHYKVFSITHEEASGYADKEDEAPLLQAAQGIALRLLRAAEGRQGTP